MFHEMTINTVYFFVIAFLSGFLFNLIFVFLDKRPGFFNSVLRDKRSGISKKGGLGLVFSFFLSVYFFKLPLPVCIGLSLTFLLGIFDDIFNFSPSKKLFGQIAIAVFLSYYGVCTQIIFFTPLVNLLISAVWIVVLMNAFNFLDILDGLAAGTSAITAAAFFFVAHRTNNHSVAVFSLALLGSNLAFLFFNFPKARLYMGDTGSMFNGAAFAAMAMMLSYAKEGKELAILTPLLILALPLYDLVFVVVMRFVSGRPVAQKSQDHFVLRLIKRGLKSYKAVLMMFFFNLLFCLAAVLFLESSGSFMAGIILFSVTVSLWLFTAHKLSRVQI